MTIAHTPSTCLDSLCASVRAAQQQAQRQMLAEIASSSADPQAMLAHLPEPLRAGKPDTYLRHVAYSDPHGSFTVFYLVWRPGQASPVHGHKTWCTYRVLQGKLSETHFQWDANAGVARPVGHALRRPGAVVTAIAGLDQVHQLGNQGSDIAISLHIYGVAQADAQTGINHLVPAA